MPERTVQGRREQVAALLLADRELAGGGGWFARGRSLQRAEQGGDAPEHRGHDGGVGPKPGGEIWFGEHGADLRPVQELDVFLVAPEGGVPDLPQQGLMLGVAEVQPL